MTSPLWQPSKERAAATNLAAFMKAAAARHGPELTSYETLYRWSIDQSEQFWALLWDHIGIKASRRSPVVLRHGDRMPGTAWFPEARLNFAENLLRYRDDQPALVAWSEDGQRKSLSFKELYQAVARLAAALKADGIGVGDRVCAVMPHAPETVIAMLATLSLGAVWSSCSPDFGVQGVLDRFGQIDAKAMIAVDGYRYNGKAIDITGKLAAIKAQLPTLFRTVIVPFLDPSLQAAPLDDAVLYASYIDPAATEIDFAQMPFSHPGFILYSSGTTGVPKAIVHSAGGTLLQHIKELHLHADLKRTDRFFYFTTCGWMMWNWQVSGLALGATLVLYDGSPFFPDGNRLFDIAEHDRISAFGTSAKFIDAVKKSGLRPLATHDLKDLRTLFSTGSPLVPESFDFVYQGIKQNLHLASISGGTDIVSCFVLGNPLAPVWRGEIQTAGLGMAVEVWDDQGQPVEGEPGELVCTRPFPSMPLGFWRDDDGSRYRDAYFKRFSKVWTHGDMIERTVHGGFIIHGRSDAVLNPGGVRIGTAEIYRQVEQIEEVIEAIAVGQAWEGDVRVILFVRLRPGAHLDQDLVSRIRQQIRTNTTPRHVPAKIIEVTDIPRTMNGKIAEIAVRDVLHGRTVKNTAALANPQALDLYRDLEELRGA